MAKLLVDRGADVSAKPGSHSPMHAASQINSPDIIRLLVQRGADVEDNYDLSRTPLHFAAYTGSLDAIKTLVELGCVIDAQDKHGSIPLQTAAETGQLEAMKLLLAAKPDTINWKSNNGWSPLHTAGAIANARGVEYLLEEGAEVDAPADFNQTPLHVQISAKEANVETTELLLLKGASPSARGQFGMTPLRYAAYWGHYILIQILLDYHADPEDLDDHLNTVLHVAARRGNAEFVRKLFDKVPGLKKTPRNKSQKAPVDVAAIMGHTSTVQLLLELRTSWGLFQMISPAVSEAFIRDLLKEFDGSELEIGEVRKAELETELR